MAEAKGANGEYEITWKSKPLGFSIVMDTSGKNAYVSSIQRAENVSKGLKLAAQIISINGLNVKDKKHSEILGEIKKAKLPMTLRFQPRSFVHDSNQDAKQKAEDTTDNDNVPTRLEFTQAPEECSHVNGEFELLIKPINGKPAWQRKDQETDPILLWFWPSTEKENQKLLGRDLWMIGRRSKLNKQDAYACVNCFDDVPTSPDLVWKCYEKSSGKWKDEQLKIEQHYV